MSPWKREIDSPTLILYLPSIVCWSCRWQKDKSDKLKTFCVELRGHPGHLWRCTISRGGRGTSLLEGTWHLVANLKTSDWSRKRLERGRKKVFFKQYFSIFVGTRFIYNVFVPQLLSSVQLFVTPIISSSVYEISQATILEWGVISFSKESSWPKDPVQVFWVFWVRRWNFSNKHHLGSPIYVHDLHGEGS